MIHLNLSICGDSNQDNPVLHKLLEEFQHASPVSIQAVSLVQFLEGRTTRQSPDQPGPPAGTAGCAERATLFHRPYPEGFFRSHPAGPGFPGHQAKRFAGRKPGERAGEHLDKPVRRIRKPTWRI